MFFLTFQSTRSHRAEKVDKVQDKDKDKEKDKDSSPEMEESSEFDTSQMNQTKKQLKAAQAAFKKEGANVTAA